MTIGLNPPRLDAGDKATGRAQYVDDIELPGMLYAALVTSPHAHARIVGYRADVARAMPGVKAIVTGDDLKGPRSGGMIKDESMIARGKVRYVGEIVAAVAAVDRETANRAAAAIEVDYEPLPAALSIDQALAAGAPILHEDYASYVKTVPGGGHDNIAFDSSVEEGDVERALRECDVVVENTWETQAQHHVYLETNGCVADVDAAGRITLQATCQSVHHIQQRVAEELGEPMAKIRVLATRVGGGFGGKHASNIHSIAAWLARAARRPVKLVLSRMQDFEIQRSRHPARIWMKTGRAARRHDRGARRPDHTRWRRLCGRKPGGAGVRLADGARALSHSQCAGARPGDLHQQAARGLVPRFRQSAGELRRRIPDRRARRQARHGSCGDPPEERDAPE